MLEFFGDVWASELQGVPVSEVSMFNISHADAEQGWSIWEAATGAHELIETDCIVDAVVYCQLSSTRIKVLVPLHHRWCAIARFKKKKNHLYIYMLYIYAQTNQAYQYYSVSDSALCLSQVWIEPLSKDGLININIRLIYNNAWHVLIYWIGFYNLIS